MRDPVIIQLEQLLAPAVEVIGCVLWGCVLQGQVLCVYIDKPGGVTVEDCAKATHQIRGVLMVHDPVRGEYALEVSSPGLDRTLFRIEHYVQYKNHKIKLRLKTPQEGQRNFEGVIENVVIEKEKKEITILCEKNKKNKKNKKNEKSGESGESGGNKKTFRFDDIAHANLVPDLEIKGISQ